MIELAFTVCFHSPVLVASGHGGQGLDAIAPSWSPVPASSLKGAMRHAATHTLRLGDDLVSRVFGSAQSDPTTTGSSPWAWSSLAPGDFIRATRARTRLDPDGGSIHPEALAFEEEWWQRADASSTLSIFQRRQLIGDASEHTDVLTAAAFAVTALGTHRNRGMGCVSLRPITAVNGEVDAGMLATRISAHQESGRNQP